MVLLEIENTGEFMNSLFLKEWMDEMEVMEGEIATFFHVKIDGRKRREWYAQEETQERQGELMTWGEYKQYAYQMIKGKKVPLLFRFVFRLPRKRMEEMLGSLRELQPEDVQGLYLNVKYEKKQLTVVTGISLRKFSLDKSLEMLWDEEVREGFKKRGIVAK